MKKKVIIGIIIAIIIILLIPIPMRLKDGGSVAYKAVLYKVTKLHQLDLDSQSGYKNGLEVEILGIVIYNNTK